MRWCHLSGILLCFLVVSCSKIPSAESDSAVTNKTDSLTLAKNKGIQNFWTAYRQATKNRIAGSWQEAINGYTIALELNNRHQDALYYLGNMHLELNDYDKAEESWEKLLGIDPLSSRAHYQLGKLYLNKEATKFFDLERAAIEFQKTTEINKDFIQPVLHLAQISLIKGNYQDSRERLQIILGSDYKNIEALFLLSYINFREGDLGKAVTYFKKAREFSIPQTPIKGVKGEGDTKTGKSLEREVSQSIFFEYYKDLGLTNKVDIEVEMQRHFTKMNKFVFQLQNL